jgi:hypothetical protein
MPRDSTSALTHAKATFKEENVICEDLEADGNTLRLPQRDSGRNRKELEIFTVPNTAMDL